MKTLCFMRLRTAGVVVGWLGIVGCTLAVVILCALLGYADVSARQFVDTKLSVFKNDEQVYHAIHQSIILRRSIYLGSAIIHLVAATLLLCGTLKKRHLMLLPWLIVTGLNIVCMFIYTLTGLYNMIGSPPNDELAAAVFSMSLSLALTIYVFSGIRALYKEIKLEKSKPAVPLDQAQTEEVSHETSTYPNYAKI